MIPRHRTIEIYKHPNLGLTVKHWK